MEKSTQTKPNNGANGQETNQHTLDAYQKKRWNPIQIKPIQD